MTNAVANIEKTNKAKGSSTSDNKDVRSPISNNKATNIQKLVEVSSTDSSSSSSESNDSESDSDSDSDCESESDTDVNFYVIYQILLVHRY